jgi:hypothetical protein
MKFRKMELPNHLPLLENGDPPVHEFANFDIRWTANSTYFFFYLDRPSLVKPVGTVKSGVYPYLSVGLSCKYLRGVS